MVSLAQYSLVVQCLKHQSFHLLLDGEEPNVSAEGVQDEGGKSTEWNSPTVADDKEELDEDDEEAAKELIRKVEYISFFSNHL